MNTAEILDKIEKLKREKPPRWQQAAKKLCDKLAELDGLETGQPETAEMERD